MSKDYWIGIDTGGTFTDLVLRQADNGQCVHHKAPTQTSDPAQGILDGITQLLAIGGVDASNVSFVVLGTTLATNAVLEGAWARTGMVTTEGFGDVLDIARQRRPHYFDLDIPKPVPPAAREHRMEIRGRLAHDGVELTPLDEQAIENAVDALKEAGIEAVAVCFMHSYASERHEHRALEIVRARWPEVYVCASADVLPEFREYERFITATVNASLMPVMDRYLLRFEQGVAALGVSHPARVMQSNGGAVTTSAVRQRPINTFFSGPAGGVMASVGIGQESTINRLITFDMGGTSTDVCLIKDGQPAMKRERAMAGLPVRTPTLDIHTIGAGGGSLAWIDAGGMLKVGPRSAGAYPGPAAYGRGGVLPTVTDANVVLGRLSPISLLDGRMKVYADQAAAAITKSVCEPLSFDLITAAVGILEIANVHMTGAVRVISVEQGEDPRDYALVAFGGAGPLHAPDIAMAAGMRHVIVPPRPGLFSAQGLLQANQRGDFIMTRLALAKDENLAGLNEGLASLAERANAWLLNEGVGSDAEATYTWQVDLRYAGQSSEISIAIDEPKLDSESLTGLSTRFHDRHVALFGYAIKEQAVEIVNVRASVVISRPNVAPQAIAAGESSSTEKGDRRPVWFESTGYTDTPILKREALGAGMVFDGPAVIEQMDTTTVVPPGATVRVDEYGYLHMDLLNAYMKQGKQ